MWFRALAARHLYGTSRLILLHRPVWDPLSVGYCLKIFPESHQEPLVSTHKNNCSVISESIRFKPVLPVLGVSELTADTFAPISFASRYRLGEAADRHQKQELGWLHVHTLPAKARSCLGYNLAKHKMWAWNSMGMVLGKHPEWFWGWRSAFRLVLNGSTVKNQYGTF